MSTNPYSGARSYREIREIGLASEREVVNVERRGDHAILRMGSPEKLNVLSAELMAQLLGRCEELVADDDIRAVILTGAGRAFSAGGDLRMMKVAVESFGSEGAAEGAFMPYQWIHRQFGAMVRLIARSETPFIAAINGAAAGVGLAFALTCDIAIAADDAVLVPAFGRLGLVPEVGTSWALTRALGYRRAFAFYVSGEQLDARRAADLGLLNEVVPSDELMQRAVHWADRIAALPPHAVPLAKPLLRAASDASWEHSLAMEEFAEPMCFTTRGFANGLREVTQAVSRPAEP